MRTRHPRIHFAVVLAVPALLLAGCSSGGSDAKTSTTKAEATTTADMTGGDDGTTGPNAGGTLERYADYETVSYDDPDHWVCRPDAEDICDGDLDATVVEADGTTTVERFEPAVDPPIDCFYVYPTISRDEGMYSDWDASDEEEGFVTLNQAARLQSECRLFAPVYRQGTLGGLTSRLGGDSTEPKEQGDPYADVLDAWKTYMAEDNDGRGVVLVGHSQGTAMLAKLLAEEIDPNEDVRDLLVGAYLAGGSIAVPDGENVGGLLQHIPICTEEGEAGCVTTWSTYRATSPPPADAFFGRPRGEGDGVAACVNPAAVGGGEADLDSYFPADAEASILSSLGTSTDGRRWLEDGTEITTPYVRLPGLVSGECTTSDGFTYLAATVHPSPDGPRADDIPGDLNEQWGLHLVDVNLVMGDIVREVAAQAQAYGD